jgi:Flp pilus assembly protein TadD
MRLKGWIFAATVALGPAAAAHAQAVLDHPHQLLGEGVGRVVAGNYRDAIPKLQAAIAEDPTMRDAHYNLAVAYRELGDNDQAITEFRSALAITGERDEVTKSQILYGLALAKDARGDRDAWNQYLSFARPRRAEQADVQIAMERQEQLNGVQIPGTQKANR